ncbi:MAG TPA: helix-turn-helix transcriptional regulator [bacterium]|nr:helix-turn-helix transcriptional regulator [bacterium]
MSSVKNKFQELLKQVPDEVKLYVQMQGDIAIRVGEIIKEKQWTQKSLAEKMGWNESQVTRLLAGHENLTLKTIAKLSVVLEENLIQTQPRVVYIPLFPLDTPANAALNLGALRAASSVGNFFPHSTNKVTSFIKTEAKAVA